MENSNKWKLSAEFQKQLERDNFDCVGHYEIDRKNYTIHLNRDAGDRKFTIYSFVSFADGGKHIRIGKVEESGLKGRLRPNYVNES
jgi:hypothetical protein